MVVGFEPSELGERRPGRTGRRRSRPRSQVRPFSNHLPFQPSLESVVHRVKVPDIATGKMGHFKSKAQGVAAKARHDCRALANRPHVHRQAGPSLEEEILREKALLEKMGEVPSVAVEKANGQPQGAESRSQSVYADASSRLPSSNGPMHGLEDGSGVATPRNPAGPRSPQPDENDVFEELKAGPNPEQGSLIKASRPPIRDGRSSQRSFTMPRTLLPDLTREDLSNGKKASARPALATLGNGNGRRVSRMPSLFSPDLYAPPHDESSDEKSKRTSTLLRRFLAAHEEAHHENVKKEEEFNAKEAAAKKYWQRDWVPDVEEVWFAGCHCGADGASR